MCREDSAMNAKIKQWTKVLYSLAGVFVFLWILPTSARAQSQFLTVDCTGATQGAYTSIQAALNYATPGTFILITGPCNENVTIDGQINLNIGAYFGQTATISGYLRVFNSTNIYLYGLNVSNPYGQGIEIGRSRSITLDTCTSSRNSGPGLNVHDMSDVTVNATGAFDRNAWAGIWVTSNSIVDINAWASPVEISNNTGPGVFVTQAAFTTGGNMTISNNVFGPPLNSGFGMDLRGGAKVQMGAYAGPNILSGNQTGGAWVTEDAEISFYGPQPNIIQGNGPVGVSVGLGSQAAFYSTAQITDHIGPAIDLYGNSQAYLIGPNQVLRNGIATDARTAAIRLDGNSQVLLRGGAVSNNNGPGLLALVNSSADFTGVNFAGNSQGVITCDSSSSMVSDLAGPNSTPPAGVQCRTPHALGNRQVASGVQPVPDMSAQKAEHDRYAKLAVKP